MAVRALSRQDTLYRRVGKCRGRECPVHRVACVARKCRRDVIGRLAGRADAVTGDACARHDADMVEARAHPGGCAMARIAGGGGHDMVGRLAHGDAAVMALSALPYDDTSMVEPGNTP